MQLQQALKIQRKEVVAFVGGGGKTSAMFRLAEELAARGKRVVTTTTTRIFAAQILLAPFHIVAESEGQVLREVREAIRQHPNLLVIGGSNEEGKALGVDPTLVDQLIGLEEIDAVLVESDGSRMRPFKAPAEHEPVIPASTTLLVPVVGIDALGRRNTDELVHRAERVAEVAGIQVGATLRIEDIVKVLGDARGGLKNKPSHARAIVLINKVETAAQSANANMLARQLLQNGAIEAVAVGAVKHPSAPVARIFSRVAAVILAAGGSTRMQGAIKQLLPWGDTTFVGNAVRVAQGSGVSEIVVVTGNRQPEIESAVSRFEGIRCVHNPEWATGRASSVRTGIGALDKKTAGAIFINADQPFLTAHVIDAVLEKFFGTGAPIVVPTYEGANGSPVLFARELFDELNALRGEQGGRDILQKYGDALERVAIEDTRAALDLDTGEEYRNALERIKDKR